MTSQEKVHLPLTNRVQRWSKVLFFVTIGYYIVLLIGQRIYLDSLGPEINILYKIDYRLVFSFLLFPLAMTLIGVWLRVKLHEWKNLILGALGSVTILMFGLLVVMDQAFVSYDYQYLHNVESVITFDFPDQGEITCMVFPEDYGANEKGFTDMRGCFVYFSDEAEIAQFVDEVHSSNLWTDSIGEENQRIIQISESNLEAMYDNFLIYNVDLQTYNKLPTTSGTYHIMFFAYREETSFLSISEYTIELVLDESQG